jgi:hypothetical protein
MVDKHGQLTRRNTPVTASNYVLRFVMSFQGSLLFLRGYEEAEAPGQVNWVIDSRVLAWRIADKEMTERSG